MTSIRKPKIVRNKCVVYLRSQFLRFALVGVFNTMLAYVVYALALAVGFFYPVANFIALVAGILVGFKIQGKFVFYRSENRLFWRFLLCWALIYGVNIAIIRQLIHLGFGPYTAGAFALPVVAVLSFIVQKYFVFTQVNAVSCLPSSFENDNSRDVSKGQ